MAFSTNILPKEAAYYKLSNASISNGILTLNPNGVAYIDIDATLLRNIPAEVFLQFYTSVPVSYLHPEVSVYLDIIMADGTAQNFTVFPSGDDNTMSVVLTLNDGEYSKFRYCIKSNIAISFLIWELCPQLETDISVVIEGVEQSLPHVLYDYNTWQLQVTQEETVIGMIACNLLGNTDVNGHFALDFYSSEYCNIYIRFRDNEITELYSPMEFTVQPGHNSIGIPHAYLKRLAGVHNFTVTCQCTNGYLDIYPRGLLYTIDAGYLAERLIDVGLDILDLTIKHTVAEDPPEEIWTVGIDAGEIIVKYREYKTQANAAWISMYSFGQGITAAIEFDGVWVRPRGTERFTLQTEEIPHIFIVDQDGNLYVYIGNDKDSAVLLDTNVTQISVVRGYKSTLYPEQDQGLVCAYIKNGLAYYRNYAYNAVTQRFAWSNVELICDDVVSFVHVHRLNDYRLGICVTNIETNLNKWYITERTYVAQAVAPELLSIYVESEPIYCTMYTDDIITAGSEILFEDDTAPQDTFVIQYDYPPRLRYTNTSVAAFTVTVNGVHAEIDTITFVDCQLLIKLKEIVATTRQEDKVVVITIDNSKCDLLLQNTLAGHLLPADSQTFTWHINRAITVHNLNEVERFRADLSVNGNVKCLSIITNKVSMQTDQLSIVVHLSNGQISELPITEQETPIDKDTLDISVSLGAAQVTIIQAGTSPI